MQEAEQLTARSANGAPQMACRIRSIRESGCHRIKIGTIGKSPMLQPKQPSLVRSIDAIAGAEAPSDSLESILGFLKRQYALIAFFAAVMIGLGLTYILTATPSYTAAASMIIDSKKVQLFQQQSMFSDMPVDASALESQVEILKSETIALAVIKKLNLTEDPEFVSGGGLISALFSVFNLFTSSSGPTSEVALRRRAVQSFQSRLSVRRIGLTYVIEISFRSYDADRAAQIANAVADAYIDDQLEAKYQAARRAGVWLQDRLGELREQTSAAERAVVAFKNSNNMVDAGGRTINEQQLAELNSQLVGAQSQTAEARARLDRIQAVLRSNSPEATVSATVADTLKNEVISKLRSQYLELARRNVDWTIRYGGNHLAVVNVRNQMHELQNSIRDELTRIAETYKSDFEIAKQREESVQRQLNEAVAQSQTTNKAQVTLRELESSAQTYRALYDNFLQRYMESVQQQSFPITEARVISAASPPTMPSHPRTRLILLMATVVGVAFGIAAGAWRNMRDRVFRTRAQVEDLLHAECIALVPAVKSATNDLARAIRAGERKRRKEGSGQKDQVAPSRRHDVNLAKNVKLLDPGQRNIEPVPGIYSLIHDEPFSAFAEAIRSIKVTVDLNETGEGGKIVGFTSSVPNEGKSSVAVAVARQSAQTGAKTLLVDCDLKNPSLSRLLAPRAGSGLLEVLRGQTSLEAAAWIDPVSNMKFLPAAMKARLADSSEMLASVQTRKFFDGLRSSYDYIFVDFAPLMPIVDVRAATHLIDGYIYVVEWGKTRTDHVEQALSSAKGVYEHLLGVVLNKVNLKAMGRYDGSGSGFYHHGNYYDRYGYSQ
jgi:polysaccharide biosynthesis transport protein